MKRILRLLFVVLSCHAAFAKIVVPTDSISVVPTNATAHGVTFSYNPTNSTVGVAMSCRPGEMPFDGVALECTNSVHHLYLPIKATQTAFGDGEKEHIIISFMMDRQLLRESTLRIRFAKGLEKTTEYVLSLKEFVPGDDLSPGK